MVYIRTAALTCPAPLLDRVTGRQPGVDAAGEADGIGETKLGEFTAGLAGTHPGSAADDHRLALELLDLACPLGKLGERNVPGLRQVPLGELVRLAHIDDVGILAVDELRRLSRIHLLCRTASEHRRQQRTATDHDQRDQQQVLDLSDEIPGHGHSSTPQKTSRIMLTSCSVRWSPTR